MITVEYEPYRHRIRISGHALFAPQGEEDLVCCAASTLAYTLANGMERCKEFRAETAGQSGKDVLVEVQAHPEMHAVVACQTVFEFILNGYRMLAEEYPDNVQVIIRKGED